MDHAPGCERRWLVMQDGEPVWSPVWVRGGVAWHSAACEDPASNRAYALRASGGDERYADAVAALLGAA